LLTLSYSEIMYDVDQISVTLLHETSNGKRLDSLKKMKLGMIANEFDQSLGFPRVFAIFSEAVPSEIRYPSL
jgi:hypothetical protein